MASPKVLPAASRGLLHPNRLITDHDSAGKSIFSTSIPEVIPFDQTPDGAFFSLCYATHQTPVDMTSNADVQTYSKYLQNKPGLTIPGGTVLRLVDMPPGRTSALHRTVSLDYGVLLEGEVELILDSGETRLLKNSGDIVVQRGTLHAWRNVNPTGWARMLFILQEAKPLELNGQVLREEWRLPNDQQREKQCGVVG